MFKTITDNFNNKLKVLHYRTLYKRNDTLVFGSNINLPFLCVLNYFILATLYSSL